MDFINENGIIGLRRNLEYPTLRDFTCFRESFVFGFKFNGKIAKVKAYTFSVLKG